MPVATGAGTGLDEVVVLAGDVFEGGELFAGEGLEAAGLGFFESAAVVDLADPADGCFFAGGLEPLLLVFLPLKRLVLFDFAIYIESL